MPRMRTARWRFSFCSMRSLTSTAAAAPSEIGAHMARVSGQAISGVASTSCTVIGVWYCASGLSAECVWFLAAVWA